MGHRANYVITENGGHELYYSHWGAIQVDRDFFFGPEVALRTIRACAPTDSLSDDVWCEGGAAVDLDRRVLRLFGGEDVNVDLPLREFWLELLRISWPGWDVAWAENGVLDLADQAGIPRAEVASRDDKLDPVDASQFVHVTSQGMSGTLLTIAEPSRPPKDLFVWPNAIDCLVAGPALLTWVSRHASVPIPPEWADGWPYDYVHVDVATRTIRVHSESFPGETGLAQLRRAAEHWNGWSVDFHRGHMRFHLSLTGRDSMPLERTTQDRIKQIAAAVLREDLDVGGMIGRLTAALGDEKVTENPHLRDPHESPEDHRWRADHFLDVLNRWRAANDVR